MSVTYGSWGSNVKDYGVKGDGSTDDASAIQTMINEFNSLGNGGLLLFPPGIYIIGTELTLYNGIVFVGAGHETVLKLKDSTNPTHGLIYATGKARIGLFDLTLDGNAANQSGGSVIKLTSCANSAVKTCRIKGGY